MHYILRFFDKLEDRVRSYFSHRPVIYSLIGGVFIVLFWYGVTVVAESVPFFNTLAGGLLLIFISVFVLLLTGLFVSFFIGDTIIISGIRHDKKVIEKSESELEEGAKMIGDMEKRVEEINVIVKDIQSKLK